MPSIGPCVHRNPEPEALKVKRGCCGRTASEEHPLYWCTFLARTVTLAQCAVCPDRFWPEPKPMPSEDTRQ